VPPPRRSVLLRAVGPAANVYPDLAQHTVRKGERLLMALTGCTPSSAPTRSPPPCGETREPPPTRSCTSRALAHAAGAPDNVAVAVGDVTGRCRDLDRDAALLAARGRTGAAHMQSRREGRGRDCFKIGVSGPTRRAGFRRDGHCE
jgi:hypothetical protein